jgi:hypothetical protein
MCKRSIIVPTYLILKKEKEAYDITLLSTFLCVCVSSPNSWKPEVVLFI